MSKSSGDFLRLQTLVDRGFHTLSYRLMCLQAHYRSELEFTWEGLQAAQTRLKRLVMGAERLGDGRAVATIYVPSAGTLAHAYRARFDEAVSNDLNTAGALPVLEEMLADKRIEANAKADLLLSMDAVLGLGFATLNRAGLRLRPVAATITEADIEARLADRKAARAAKDFATSDRIRDDLIAAGVEVMDGDPLGWDWRPTL